MPSMADIKTSSILDTSTLITTSATVGVDKTWEPAGFDAQGVAKWEDRSGGIPAGFPTLTLGVRGPTRTSRITKVTVKLVLPTLESATGANPGGFEPAPQKAYDVTFVGEFMLPERCADTERAELLNHLVSLFATTITASDASPSDATASPVRSVIEDYARVF